MYSFLTFLKEEDEGGKLKHITHAEDRPLQNGSEGFDHAVGALQQAKNVLVKNLETNTGGLEHHINNKPTGPEGFVVNYGGEPTKLVNRAEFAKANLLRTNKFKKPE